MSEAGWIKLSRGIWDNFIWDFENPKYTLAWIDILLMANHKDKKIMFDGKPEVIERGSFVTSMVKLAERWHMDRKTVKKFLEILQNNEMISYTCSNKRTAIKVLNYGLFQDFSEDKWTAEGTAKRTAESTPHSPPRSTSDSPQLKNIKNVKNIKNNIYSSNFCTFWGVYPNKADKAAAYKCYQARLKDGYSEEELLKATKNYAKECEQEKREKKFIKHAKTFLGPNTPFVDYLGEKKDDRAEQTEVESRGSAADYYKQFLDNSESDQS